MTNAERINQMTVEEKAKWIMDLQEDDCNGCIYYKHNVIWMCNRPFVNNKVCQEGREKWLKAEADNGEEG